MRELFAVAVVAYVIVAQFALYFAIERSTWREGLVDWQYLIFGTVWLFVFVVATRATYKGVMLADWERWDTGS